MGSATIQGKLWGTNPEDWTFFQESKHYPLWEKLLDVCNVGQYTKILDAGCGGGGASVLAEKRGAIVNGLDASNTLIEVANNRVKNGIFQVGDIESLPFANGSFDVVFACNSLQYSENKVNTLKELKRVVGPKGRVAVALFGSPDKVEFSSIFKAMGDLIPADKKNGGGPFALSDLKVLQNLASQAGLTTDKHGEVNCPFYYYDFDQFWKGMIAAGPTRHIADMVGDEKMKEALEIAVVPFTDKNGKITFGNNKYLYLVLK